MDTFGTFCATWPENRSSLTYSSKGTHVASITGMTFYHMYDILS